MRHDEYRQDDEDATVVDLDRQDSVEEATAAVERLANRFRSLYTPTPIHAAAELVDDWVQVALRAAANYPGLAESLAGSALEAVERSYRPAMPSTVAHCEEMLCAVHAALVDRGVAAAYDRERGVVVVPRSAMSPAWGPSGTADLAVCVTIYDGVTGGWALCPDRPAGRYLVEVVAPCTPPGAGEVADLALEIIAGSAALPVTGSG